MNGTAATDVVLAREAVVERLEELRAELAKGRRRAEALEAEQQELHATRLRISGAIQVLGELTGQSSSSPAAAAGPPSGEPGEAAVPSRGAEPPAPGTVLRVG